MWLSDDVWQDSHANHKGGNCKQRSKTVVRLVAVLFPKVMENRSKTIDKCLKVNTERKNKRRCNKKCMFRARRKLVFDEETSQEWRPLSKTESVKRLMEDQTDWLAEISLSDQGKCMEQYNFDLVSGQTLDGTFDFESMEGTTPAKAQKCGEIRQSLVH